MTVMTDTSAIYGKAHGASPDRSFLALSLAVFLSLAIHGSVLLLFPGNEDRGVARSGQGGITVSLGPAGRSAGGEVAAVLPPSETAEEPITSDTETIEAMTAPERDLREETTAVEPDAVEPDVAEPDVAQPDAAAVAEPVEMRSADPVPPVSEPDLVLEAEVPDVADVLAPVIAASEVEAVETETQVTVPTAAPEVRPEETVAAPRVVTAPLPKRRPQLVQKLPSQDRQQAERPVAPKQREPQQAASRDVVTETEAAENAQLQAAEGDSARETANQLAGEGGRSGDSGLSEAGQGNNTAGGGAPGVKSDYYREVTAWLEKHKRYPRRSKLRNEQGVVLLRFVVERDGMVTVSGIKESSGYKRLDKEAMGMIERAQPLPPIPPEMRQAKLDLVIPVKFNLR